MASRYELWLLDDSGRRITLLEDMAFFSYSRTVKGFSTVLVGIPYDAFVGKIYPIFEPDRRIEVWRSAGFGIPLRREGVYLLRKPKIYTREDDVTIITFYGRDAKDLLRRRVVIQPAGYPETRKTAPIDDMMKEIVREQMLYDSALDETGAVDNRRAFPEYEFTVQGNLSLGPDFTATFAERKVLDVLKELQDASFQLNKENSSNARIYFDVIPFDAQGKKIYILDEETGNPILAEDGEPIEDEESPETSAKQGFEFVTFANLRGLDRSNNSLVFSVENNNLASPYYTLSYMDEENSIIVKGFGRGDSRAVEIVNDDNRIAASRWNLCEGYEDASTEPEQDNLADFGYARLHKGSPLEEISAVFLNIGESDDTPRSLYGIDWDMGDLLPVEYAGKQFVVEVSIVYVAVDENGVETITGRSDVNKSY